MMNNEEKFQLITENLQEVIRPEVIKGILAEGRPVKIYWGTATTGAPHCGYFIPAVKIAQFLAAGCDVTILIADIHGFLDSGKAPLDLVEDRTLYYERIIPTIFESIGIDTSRLRTVRGSSYQDQGNYFRDVLRLSSLVSAKKAKKAGAEVVKQDEDSMISASLYPIMQSLDEEYLGVDAQFGGMDQRKLFMAAAEWLPKLGYQKRAHLMNPILPGLRGKKMSSSDPDGKIDMLDSPDDLRRKIRKAVIAPRVVEDNGLLALVQYILLPAAGLKGKREFGLCQNDSTEPTMYTDIEKINEDYANDIIGPQALKTAVAEALVELTSSIRAKFDASPEWQEIRKKAYPSASGVDKPAKKEKKPKNKGDRRRAGANGEGPTDGDAKAEGATDGDAKVDGAKVEDAKAEDGKTE